MTLDDVSHLFNLGLAVLFCCLLWNLVHPEHFDWVRMLRRRFLGGKPVTVKKSTEQFVLALFVIFCVCAAVFGLLNLLTYGSSY